MPLRTNIPLQTNIPQAKRIRIAVALKGRYPIPMVPDPKSTPDDILPLVPEYTDDEWLEVALIKIIKREVKAWETKIATKAAADSILSDIGLFG